MLLVPGIKIAKKTHVCRSPRCSSGCRCPFRCSTSRRSWGPGCCTPVAGIGDSRRCKTTTTPTRTTFRRRPDKSGRNVKKRYFLCRWRTGL